ncbi:MAG: SDR family oxidoreductase [Rickettsiales bacterium TMED254]|nr:NAD-dependent dehydratase [Rickettsiales bacterium]RPF78246.1 MAG: SDR family oxidoreductase [Rickettsiales bacterium TMED254]|tara:strand:+ start:511 stop:1455 length:945 start_codon:yes stop_codon:yes gene_type:complete
MKKKRILVTGGAGFLGSFLCEKLIKSGHYVVCCDNFYTGNKDNLSEIIDHKNLEIIRHDITFPLYLEIDEIYNFACPASPIHYQNDPVQTIKTCVHGAINMLGLAKRTKARILQASTSEIYGDPEVHPQKETYKGAVSINGPRACYDEGKRCAETIFWDYERQHNVDIKVIRIFNTYGPRMQINDGRVVSNFIVQALKNKNITVYGEGNQTRSFCYVDDLIDGIFKMMNKPKLSGPINLGNPLEITIKKLAEEIIELTGSSSKLIYKDLPQDDPQQRCPDISLALKEIQWEPKINRTQGLKKTIDYFENILKND